MIGNLAMNGIVVLVIHPHDPHELGDVRVSHLEVGAG